MTQGGSISFQEYMNHALYAPGLGYYSAGSRKIGAAGDFITAPEISPLFAACLARHCRNVLAQSPNSVIFELGAGSGKLAADLLLALEALDSLPQSYWILEISGDLRARQRDTLIQRCPHLLDTVKWLEQLPDKNFTGIVLGNEVLDALPVSRFVIENAQVMELGIQWTNDRFTYCQMPAGPALQDAVRRIEQCAGDLPEAYCSEVNLLLPHWLASIAEHLAQGLMLWIDYGYPRREYYAPQRRQGTLQCYYRHRVHDDALAYPGLQDITAHVDFTQVAEAASACGFSVAGYTNQMSFLINCGLEAIQEQALAKGEDPLKLTQQIKTLISPQAMGENFKVMALTKNFVSDLLGFQTNSLLAKL